MVGALVGGAVAALPSLGAERRALRAEQRRELRTALLRVIEATRKTQAAVRHDDSVSVVGHGREWLQELSVLGTLVGPKDDAVIEYLSKVMGVVIGEQPEGDEALREASLLVPAWYRDPSRLAVLKKASDRWPSSDELIARDNAS